MVCIGMLYNMISSYIPNHLEKSLPTFSTQLKGDGLMGLGK